MIAAETVEHRLGKVRVLVPALACVAERGGERDHDETTCIHLELIAKEELDKVTAALDVEVLNKDC